MYKLSPFAFCFLVIVLTLRTTSVHAESFVTPPPPRSDRYTTYQGKVSKYVGPEHLRSLNRRRRIMGGGTTNDQDDREPFLDDTVLDEENNNNNNNDPRIRRYTREVPVEVSLPEGYLEYVLMDALKEWNETNIRTDFSITYYEREVNLQHLEAQRRFETLTSQIYYHDIQLQQKIMLLEKASRTLLETVEAEVHLHHSKWYYPTLALGFSVLIIGIGALVIIYRTPSMKYYQFPKSFV